MKVLSVILTSSKFDLLIRSINSVVNQYKVNFEYKIIINVNTLNEQFYQKVLEEIPKLYDMNKLNMEIIRTESNGRPGKGHNSCLELFKQKTQYDYLTILDGDDLYYPCAFQRFEKYIQKYPKLDLLHLMLNDRVHFNNEEDYTSKKLLLNYKLIGGFTNTENWWKSHDMKNPFNGKIADNKTPSRIILCSRNIFNTTYPITYSENARLYDDYVAFCSFYEAQLRNEINTYSCSDTHIYLYNSLNDFSVSYKFSQKDHNDEQKMWEDDTKNYTLVKNHNWKIHELPYAIVELPTNFKTLDKILFCQKEVTNYELYKNQERIQYINTTPINEKTKESIEFNLLYLIKSGFDTEENIKTIIDFYLKINQPNHALFYLFKLEEYPSLENYEYIFNNLYNLRLYNRLQKYVNILKRFKNVSTDIIEKINNLEFRTVNNHNIYKTNKVNINLNPNKKTLIYYTGFSGRFNGKNIEEKPVYGSELAAVKLCEKLKDNYNTIILCETNENLFHNGVFYINYNLYNQLLSYYDIDYFIISRFISVFMDLDLKIIKNIYYILHDSRPHNQYYEKMLSNLALPLYFNFHKKIDKHLLVSKWQQENLTNIYKQFKIPIDTSKFHIIGNGIDTLMNKNKKFKKDPYKFIYSSNPSRGLLPLCKIIVELQKKYKDITLDIYFSHIEDKKIVEYIQKYDFIKFNGKIKNSVLMNKLSESTFWVYPNLYSHETFCIACLEAMNNKNVVITRDFSALPELVHDKNLLIPTELDENDLVKYTVEKIDKLMNNRKEITNIQEYLYKRSLKFDWNNVYKKIIKILN